MHVNCFFHYVFLSRWISKPQFQQFLHIRIGFRNGRGRICMSVKCLAFLFLVSCSLNVISSFVSNLKWWWCIWYYFFFAYESNLKKMLKFIPDLVSYFVPFFLLINSSNFVVSIHFSYWTMCRAFSNNGRVLFFLKKSSFHHRMWCTYVFFLIMSK